MLRKILEIYILSLLFIQPLMSAEIETKIKKKSYLDYKSLMFTEQNIQDIFKSLLKFGNNKSISPNADINNMQNPNDLQTIIDENNLSIYLNSIMYISKDNWAIWLNESKITSLTNGEGEIKVLNISPLSAKFAWTVGTSRWNIINANGLIPQSKYKIDKDQVVMFFTLSPNQTYTPSTDMTIEGKIKKEVPETADENKTEDNGQLNNRNNNIDKNDKNIETQNATHDDLFF